MGVVVVAAVVAVVVAAAVVCASSAISLVTGPADAPMLEVHRLCG
jgi:hypothetical protein